MKKIEPGKFRRWLKKLKDETGKARIVARINRLIEGLPGDVSPVGQGGVNYGFILGLDIESIFISRTTNLLSCFAAVTKEVRTET